jgi:DNA-binding CsgD family transcriptional regulator
LVFAHDRRLGATLVRALEGATFDVDWVRNNREFRARAARPELAAPIVVFVVPAGSRVGDPDGLAELAVKSCLSALQRSSEDRGTYLEAALRSYAVTRLLSVRQQRVLRLYLGGSGDKEIAGICKCSEATVYEHWRRMARKAGGHHKGDAISDFHRFLGANSQGSELA